MTDIGLGPNAQQHQSPKFDPYTGKPLDVSETAAAFVAPEPQPIKATLPEAPANPYAPVWRVKERAEVDVTLPSGQTCRVLRLERDDILRLGLLEYLDTFTPMLFDDEPQAQSEPFDLRKKMKEDPKSIGKMLTAVDKVVLATCLRPKLTEDPNLVNVGTEADWANPNFTATVLLDAVDNTDRMLIFGAAFGRSMDDLKSALAESSQSVSNVANGPGV